jgi:hypothetical protein
VVHVAAARRVDAHRPLLDDQVHQVEEVAALLDQRPAGVAVEAVPVADLAQEREAMLSDREHPDPADRAAVYLLDEPRDGPHVAVLHADPHDGGMLRGRVDEALRVVDVGRERLLDEHVLARREDGVEHRRVRVVRRRDDDRVDRRIA